MPNPLALSGGAGELMELLETATSVLAPVGFACAVAAIVVRMRRSRGVERTAAQVVRLRCCAGRLGLALSVVLPSGIAADAAFLLGMLALAGLPTAAGLAILRHRLYDIDVVINRTLVYGALTATLAGSYAASVLVLQLVLDPLTEGSGIAIAASTLAVATLFRPARACIQALVDRRFYRHKYDAARTLEAFSARLRQEVDLDALAIELRAVVQDTMQPAHVSLWLRSAPERR